MKSVINNTFPLFLTVFYFIALLPACFFFILELITYFHTTRHSCGIYVSQLVTTAAQPKQSIPQKKSKEMATNET